MIQALAATAPAVMLGWLLVRRFAKVGALPPWLRWTTEISVGAGLGLGITSGLYFVLLWMGVMSRGSVLAVEGVAMAAAIVVNLKRAPDGKTPAAPIARASGWTWGLRTAAVAAVLCSALGFFESTASNPNGEWDAFSVWNVRARYLAGGAGTWRNAVASQLPPGMMGAAHPGYPLLLSASVARVWTLTGEQSEGAPEAVALWFAIAAAGLLCGAVAGMSTEIFGLLALLVVLATESFVSQAAFQYADIPLAFFLLATVAMLAAAERDGWPPGTLAMAGAFAGLAAWTKNEGLPFVLAAVAVAFWRSRGRGVWMAAGAMPGVLLTLALKSMAQGTEAVLPKTLGEILHKAADPSRWWEVTASFGRAFWEMGVWWAHPLLLLVAVGVVFGIVTRQEARARWWIVLPVAVLMAADFGLYLVTTAQLSWHLTTSNSRVLLQVWPALLFFAFLFFRPSAAPPEPELVAVVVKRPNGPGPKRKRGKADA